MPARTLSSKNTARVVISENLLKTIDEKRSIKEIKNCLNVRGRCTCEEMLVIPVNRVVDKDRIIGKNEGPRRQRGMRGL
jgi:hypothetical protein